MPRNADRLDMSVTFQPVNIAVMTVSDTRTEADDKSGSLLVSRIEEIPDQGELLVHCAGGIRSAAAAAELRRRGYDAVNVAGGWSAMTRSGCGSAVTAC